MYDALLITTHYDYDEDGRAIPPSDGENHEDLSMIVPLGIIHIAQYLYDCGVEVRVVHIPHEMQFLSRFGIKHGQEEGIVEKILRRYPAHVCGIQAHWYLYCGGALYVAELYRRLFPESRIFLGGYMATACWREFLRSSKNIDGVILGEGEKAFKEIVRRCQHGGSLELDTVDGVAFRRENAGFIYNPPRKGSLLDVDEIPIIKPDAPPFSRIFWQKRHFISISRGRCPEKCSYCVGNSREINTRAYQTLRTDRILEQIGVYREAGVHDLFLGENHFLNIPFMRELIQGIIREDFKMCFELETHPVIFQESGLLEKMIQAGFLKYTMGCESGSDSLLKRIGRNSNAGLIIASVKAIAERGGIVLTSWISNLPGETESEFRETQEIMKRVVKAGGFIYWIENLHVLPGSEFCARPGSWQIVTLLNNLEDWIRWGVLSKKYVKFDDAYREPLRYLTHLNRGAAPEQMIERLYSNRELAVSLLAEMRSHLATKYSHLPSDMLENEIQVLDWYETKGWKLLLF